MKTYTIRWIIGLISIALIGLLCVQLYWVDNAVNLKQVLFRQSVNGALSEVVARLEKREVASAVAQTVTLITDPEHANDATQQHMENYIVRSGVSPNTPERVGQVPIVFTADSIDALWSQNELPITQLPTLQSALREEDNTIGKERAKRTALRDRTIRERAVEEAREDAKRAALREQTMRERTVEDGKSTTKNDGNRYVQPSSNKKPQSQQREYTYQMQYSTDGALVSNTWTARQTLSASERALGRVSEQSSVEKQLQALQIHAPTAIIDIAKPSEANTRNQVLVVNIDSLRCGVQLLFDSSNTSEHRIVVRTQQPAPKRTTRRTTRRSSQQRRVIASAQSSQCVHQCTENCEEDVCTHTCKEQCTQQGNYAYQQRTLASAQQRLQQRMLKLLQTPYPTPNELAEQSLSDIMESLAEQQEQARERIEMLQEAIEDVSIDFSFPATLPNPNNGMYTIGAQQQPNWLSAAPFSRTNDKVRIDHSNTSISDALSRSAKRASAPPVPTAPVAATAPASLPDPQSYPTPPQPVRDKLLSIQDMASRVIVELATSKKPIEQRITPNLLDSMLKEELLRRGITIPYQYAVLSQENEFPLIKPALYTDELQQSDFRTALYPNDLINKPYFLSIYFPQKDAFIYESMGGVLATSLAFILLLMGCFSFAVVTLVRQKKLSDMKTDFINNMTHEFKTPISTISLASEALRDPIVRTDDNRITRFVNAIYEENRRLGTQVERVLQAAVIDRGEIQLNRAPVHLHDIMRQALGTVALQIESRGGNITCLYRAENDVLHADRIHLANIIINLLDNANKYSPDAPSITVATYNSNEGIIVSVEDRGMGMSREAQKRIFEKFYRVSTGNLHDVKGFGLGLSYAKAMVEAHGGTISVWSELKKGSRFDLYFPHTNPIEQ